MNDDDVIALPEPRGRAPNFTVVKAVPVPYPQEITPSATAN